jgi:GntR family transcriptional regulator
MCIICIRTVNTVKKGDKGMFQLDFGDHRPIYEQIKEKLKFLIIGGALKDGDKIPSVRELAVSMTINPNTVQRAYKELESEGYIFSQQARGYFVAPREIAKNQDSAELLEKFTDMAKELLYQGKTKDELISIIDTLYKGGKADGND